jgi:hypothetical protein
MIRIFPLFLLASTLLLHACKKDPDCAPGFTGANCSEELVPFRMYITAVEVLDWPLSRPDGAAFDRAPDSRPDVAIGVFRDTVPLWNTAFYYEDAAQSQPLAFTALSPIVIDEPLARYALAVWDWDPGQNGWDELGAVEFTPYEPGRQFPGEIVVACQGCPVRLRLSVRYEH